MCKSRSAEVFCKSGAYAAVAKASVRKVRREEELKRLSDAAAKLDEEAPLRLVITRRNTISLKGDREFKVETTVMRDRSASMAENLRPSNLPRRLSESRKKARAPRYDHPAPVVWKHPSEAFGSRERDENNFRRSNAKLPERREDLDHLASDDWNNFRRGRNSTPFLGRYTRTTSSQLPQPSKARRRPQSAISWAS